MAYDVTSQWDDIHRKLGNYEELPVVTKEWEHSKVANEKMDNYDPLEGKKETELDDLEDDLEDDFLRKYKETRMMEMTDKKKDPTFIYVKEISKVEYKSEVNEAPKGVWVVLLLYQNYLKACNEMLPVMEEAAKKYEGMKFLKSVATKCIENYKDILCPTLIIYKDGEPYRQLVRFDKEYRKMTMASFDDLLVKHKMVDTPLHADDEDAKYYKGIFFIWGTGKNYFRLDAEPCAQEKRQYGFR